MKKQEKMTVICNLTECITAMLLLNNRQFFSKAGIRVLLCRCLPLAEVVFITVFFVGTSVEGNRDGGQCPIVLGAAEILRISGGWVG